jgi:uncharacterized cupin superfamily protein
MKPIIRKPSKEEKEEAESWPIWEKEISEFPWKYDTNETFLVIEGDVIVTNEDGKEFHFKEGDYVIFPKGMKCNWKINKDIRKYYKMG